MNLDQEIRCGYYDRKDWVKIDVNEFLDSLVDQVANRLQIKKTPAKSVVVFSIFLTLIEDAEEIFSIALNILDRPEEFKARYLTKMRAPKWMELPNYLPKPPNEFPPDFLKANFLDLVDVWAGAINRACQIGIVQCRDVVKLALGVALLESQQDLHASMAHVFSSLDSDLFRGPGTFVFPHIELEFQDPSAEDITEA